MNKTLLNKQANFNTWVKIKFIHPSVYKDKRMSAEITVFIGCAQMFSSRMTLACSIGQLLYEKQFLRKGRLSRSFVLVIIWCFIFSLKKIIYCPWSTELYLQTFTCICQIKVLATQMDTSWHTMAYSNLSSANPAQYWIHGGLFKI